MSSQSFSSADTEFLNVDASNSSPVTPRSHVSNASMGSVQSPLVISSSSSESIDDEYSPFRHSRPSSPPYRVENRYETVTDPWIQTRVFLATKSEKLIRENGPLRERLRKARVKVPVNKGEDMFYHSRRGTLDSMRDACYRLQDENERMVLRERRNDWHADNPYFEGTGAELRAVLSDLDLLSPFDLSDGDEPLD